MDLLVLEKKGAVGEPIGLPNLFGEFIIYMYVEGCKLGYGELVWIFV